MQPFVDLSYCATGPIEIASERLIMFHLKMLVVIS